MSSAHRRSWGVRPPEGMTFGCSMTSLFRMALRQRIICFFRRRTTVFPIGTIATRGYQVRPGVLCYPFYRGRCLMEQASRVPLRAWVVTFAGTAVNLCLGILYAWSVWKGNLVADANHPAGSPMTGLNEGWSYLTDAQATSAYAICGFVFAVFMI